MVFGLDPEAAGDWRAATGAFSAAVNQLHLSVWRGLARADQARLLARWTGLASDAAAAAINMGDGERAVELLDHGRYLLWGQALDARTDLSALRAVRPDLADELETLHTVFAAGAWTDERGAHSTAEHRRRLALDWERLVNTVPHTPRVRGLSAPHTVRRTVGSRRRRAGGPGERECVPV